VTGKDWCVCLILLIFSNGSLAHINAVDSLTNLIENERDLKRKAELIVERSNKLNNTGNYDQSIRTTYPILKQKDHLGPAELSGLYFSIGISHYYSDEFDSCIHYFEKSEPLSKSEGLLGRVANNYITRGSAFFSKGNVATAIDYFNKARETFLSIKDTVWATKASINLSIAFAKQDKPLDQLTTLKEAKKIIENSGDFRSLMILKAQLASTFSYAGITDSSVWYYTQALKTAERIGDSVSMAIYYGNISQMHTNVEQFDNAKVNAQRAIKINKKLGRHSGLSYSHFAMGRIYDNLGISDSSLSHYNLSLKYALLTNNGLQSSILLNRGIVLMDNYQYDSTLFYLNKAIAIERRSNKSSTLTRSYTTVARVYMDINNLGLSSLYLDSAIENALYFNIHRNVADVYDALSELETLKGNTAKALTYYKLFKTYRDSTMDSDRLLKTQFISSLHEKEKKEAAIKELKRNEKIGQLELANVKQQRWSLIAVSTSLLLIGMILIRSYGRKRKANLLLEKANTLVMDKNKQLEVLNQEIYHRAKNNLQTISSLLSLQRFDIKDENARELIVENRNRVNAMALINRRLFSEERLTKVAVSSFVLEITKELAYTYNVPESVFKIEDHAGNQTFDADKAVPLSLVINELISNAIKHAIPESETPEVRIHVSSNKGLFKFSIHDNGPGFKQGSATGKTESFGWEMVQMMVEQLQGKLQVSNKNGALVEVSFPATK